MKKLVKRLSAIGVGFAACWVVCTGREITPPGPLLIGLIISFGLAFIGAAIVYWGLT